jgi:hypothetical protein
MVISLTALAAGCGGGSDSSSNSTTSAADWASGYCGAASTWVTTLDKARASVKPNDPAATASDAAQQVTAETNTFTETIKGLGEPDTPDGAASAATAKTLADTLVGRMARASSAINTNNPDVTPALQVKTVRDQVTASLADVAKATTALEQGDDELGTAMHSSSDCTDLNTALSKAT